MENKTLTAIEWLDEQLQDKMYVQYGYGTGIRKIVIPIEEYIYFKQQAKAMEKQQIEKAIDDALNAYGIIKKH